jgi:chromosomal replication initiation ATPase DnaA
MKPIPQIVFDFIPEKSYLQDDFVVSSCNIDAFRAITSWPRNWENKCLFLFGTKSSGKTFLSKIWKEISEAVLFDINDFEKIINSEKAVNIIIEDTENLLPKYQEEIFHLYNKVSNSRAYILVTSSKPLISLDINLPDLKSRISAATHINIQSPDNDLIKSLIFKQFSDAQVTVSTSVIDFIVPRIERSFEAVHNTIDFLNKKSFETQRNITIPFVKEFLGL